jgi:hypothetical protein
MLTLPDILAAYRKSSPDGRVFLREQYPRLRLEFDAIEREEDRAARMDAQVTLIDPHR